MINDIDYCDKHCVCTIVREIIAAQNDVARKRRPTSSCEQAIKELRSHKTDGDLHSTVPFMLYNQSFKPFIASGVHQIPIEGYPNETYYTCIETPIFRANRLLDNKGCCAIIELLQPVNANGFPIADQGDKTRHFFQHHTPFKTIYFRKTGICITVELQKFSGISCLEPITPLDKY